MNSRTIALRCLPLVALLAVGCESETASQVEVHPVHGQVMYDGKPAAGVRVYFMPLDAPRPPAIPTNPHAVTKGDGTFALSTFATDDGAAAGTYAVVMIWPKRLESEDEEETDEHDRLLGWYSGGNSRIEARVKSSDTTLPPFQLPARKEPPTPGSEGIPGRN